MLAALSIVIRKRYHVMLHRHLLAALVFCSTLVWGSLGMAEDITVSGTATYKERIAVRPGTVLEVQVLDVSRADAPSVTLASRRYAVNRVPFPFSLDVDADLIDDRFTYSVSATLSLDGKVINRTTQFYPVLTRDAPNTVDVVMDQMKAAPAAPALVGTTWNISEIRGKILIVEKRPSIAFLDQGRVSVDTGCNRANGGVEISGTALSFSKNMATTRMACVPPYDKLENDILGVLPEVTGYVHNADHLALVNSAGVTIMRLFQSD
jgi:putative lipoprotein